MSVHTPSDHPGSASADRDRSLRRAGRLRRTLVGTSVAATLGVAAVVGAGVGHPGGTVGAPGTAGTVGTGSATTGSSSEGSSDDSGSSVGTAPSLLAGSGTSHATSSGS